MTVQRIGAEGLPGYLKLPTGTTVSMSGPSAGLALSNDFLAYIDGSDERPFFIMSRIDGGQVPVRRLWAASCWRRHRG